jgi:hypothetical protein
VRQERDGPLQHAERDAEVVHERRQQQGGTDEGTQRLWPPGAVRHREQRDRQERLDGAERVEHVAERRGLTHAVVHGATEHGRLDRSVVSP